MTLEQARFVIKHRSMYSDAWYHYALEVVESYERQADR